MRQVHTSERTNKTRRDRYLILDLECACWEDEVPEGMRNDIISVGLVEIDTRQREIVREAEYFIRPRNAVISEFCTSLTGITTEHLRKHGRPFPEVMRSLHKEFGVGNKVWMAWGDDRDVLRSDCRHHRIEMPFSDDYVNLSAVLGFAFGRHKKFGLRRAMQAVGLEFEGRQHSALADARNTARLWMTVARTMSASFSHALGEELNEETAAPTP